VSRTIQIAIWRVPTACVLTHLYPQGPPTNLRVPALCLPRRPPTVMWASARVSLSALHATGRMPDTGRRNQREEGGRGGRRRHGAEMRGCSMDAASDPASASDPMLPPGHSRLGEGGASGGWRRRPTLKGRGKDRAERARSYRFGRPASPRRG
jgi:hypothetical protein